VLRACRPQHTVRLLGSLDKTAATTNRQNSQSSRIGRSRLLVSDTTGHGTTLVIPGRK